MSYMALYRKWRPVSFEDVKGQDPVVQTLKIRLLQIGSVMPICSAEPEVREKPVLQKSMPEQ